MPPAPRITVTIDQHHLQYVCDELRIDVPDVRIKQNANQKPGKVVHGTYYGELHRIILNTDIEQLEVDRLRSAQLEVLTTFLHELRHGWQYKHNRQLFDATIAAETDAEGWAIQKVVRYRGLLRLSRKQHGSGFSRMNRHASRQ